ncbi:MAG: carbohydrate kinase [Balneolaceae bacterium]|nr:carbohydrate kinase [Balneolaceae bacterium]MBO6545779.1 carbohydrate kinase [Balneolaceae bacterium]MBO6647175.1 carbohydrate kinase [Balneolaceae bacterium]
MFLGIDLGSSSIKLSLLDAAEGRVIASLGYPKEELAINAPHQGWAEQEPEMWWRNFLEAYSILVKEHSIDTRKIQAIGISYQMHGLVLVDKNFEVLRASIIWCDSRAVEVGNKAFESLGSEYCLPHLLNSPGNFTASKLAWVKQNEPEVYAKGFKFMLPGDYIAMRLTGTPTTTEAGLSEGVFWDFKNREVSKELLSEYEISEDLIPEIVPAIGSDLKIQKSIANKLGLSEGVAITYRGGDQPNNAFSLNVLNPGETASTAGTSGVIYAVTDKNAYDQKSRINTFLHVNDTVETPRNGVLICINGTGILYNWLRRILNTGNGNIDYIQMNEMVGSIAPGSDGLTCLPFGNGSERIFENRIVGSHLLNMDFNRHQTSHILRASVEGIVYALNLGFEMLKDLGIPQKRIRAGHANLFLSQTFREIFVNVTGLPLELYNTDGAAGAARGAALGSGFYSSPEEAFSNLEQIAVIEPDSKLVETYKELFEAWKQEIEKHSF